MNVLGLDVGFSITKATNSLCLLNVDEERKRIGLVERAKRFLRGDATELFRRLSRFYPEIKWVSVDAPLTPVRLSYRPKSGRSVDKRFSKGVFHSSQGGPQPGSISVPLQGWPLYEAGMDIVEKLRETTLGDYLPFEDFEKAPSSGVIECIPKLTQALLVPREVVRERRGTVDDYLFPLLFEKEGPYRRVLDRALGDYRFTSQVEEMISEISLAPNRHHEELAAIVAAVQGVLVAIGRASVVGCAGDSEGYYALPHREDWDPDWLRAFGSTCAGGVEVTDLSDRPSADSLEAEPMASRPGTDYERLVEELERFVAERDWEQFHSPKNLAMALSVEVAEIVEHFQWLTEEQSRNLPQEKLAEVREEIGDVMIYLTELAEKLEIDPVEAAQAKLELNSKKYPAALVKGKAAKYTEYR
jgi:NTP pyrophosphatase (non-canonical NTP hydrolase)